MRRVELKTELKQPIGKWYWYAVVDGVRSPSWDHGPFSTQAAAKKDARRSWKLGGATVIS